MKQFLQANTFVKLPDGDDIALIPIFPAGEVKGFDGRGPYYLTNPAGVIAASLRPMVDLVIDRDHETDLAPKGTRVKAAGWIKKLVEKDGALFAHVEWTPAARQEMADKEYRYISPVFRHDKDTGEVTRILRASLTNTPNFEMQAVASAQSQQSNDMEENIMDKYLLAIASALGLEKPENEQAVVDKAKEVAATLKETQTSLASAAKALGLDEKAKGEEIATAAADIQATAKKPNPEEYVPMDMFNKTAAELASVQKSLASDKAETAVAEAMKAGKIAPAQKDWALDYASSNPDAFKKFIEAAPVIAAATNSKTGERPANQGELDDDALEIASQLGLKPDDMKEALKEQAA